MRMLASLALIAANFIAPAAFAGDTSSPAGAAVYIISPADGAVVSGPVVVRFGLRGMGIAPAGVEKAKTGHHHLLIDTDAPMGEDLGYALPADEKVRHFGGGQTEVTLTLPKGEHTLQLLLGDQGHVPHNPPVLSKRIHIHVQ